MTGYGGSLDRQELQERMNCLNDSGEIPEVESNKSGKFDHFPSQPAVFQVHILCWAATNACRLTHGICLDHRKTFFGNPRTMFDSSQTPYQEILHSTTHQVLQVRFQCMSVQGHLLQEAKNELGAQFHCRDLQEGRRQWIPFLPVDIPQNFMVGQQRQQISELEFDKFHTPSTFPCWKIRLKNQVTTCSDFPSEGILWIKEVETVDSVDDFNKPSRSIGQRESLLLWTRSPRILTSRRRSVSRNRKPKMMSDFHEEDRSLSWSTTTFESVLDYADLFSVTPRDDNVQEFDTRWDGISSSMTKIPSDDILESLYKLRIRESDPLKTV